MMQDNRDLIEVMVSIMRARRASTRVAELAANIIAADARLNTRIGDAKAQGVLGDRIFDLLEFGDALLSECKTLERQFDEGLSQELLCDRLAELSKKIDMADS